MNEKVTEIEETEDKYKPEPIYKDAGEKLMVDRAIVAELGYECADILVHINFWTGLHKHRNMYKSAKHDGEWWCYRTLNQLVEVFTHMSKNTIRRRIKKMEDAGIIFVEKYGKGVYSEVSYFRINKKVYKEICDKFNSGSKK